MGIRNACVIALLALFAAGCASTSMYRTDKDACTPNEPEDDAAPPQCAAASVERRKDFDIAYVELTDQGWLYQRKQLERALDLLRNQQEKHLEVIVFVHGWKHSARAGDADVTNFRKNVLPALASKAPGTRTVGIYVGWRGASLDVPSSIQSVTYYDRKATADHVARGSVRELFAHLQAIREERIATGRQVKLILVGHSFGGLIVFNSVAESLLKSLVVANHGEHASARKARPIADLIVLLNPAFEASRFEPLFQAAKDCLCGNGDSWPYADSQRPLLVSITSEADLATKIAFPLGRSINSIFEHEGWTDQDDTSHEDYGGRLEKVANTHTTGHMERYRTHRLELGASRLPGGPDELRIDCRPYANPPLGDVNRFPLWNMYAAEQVIDGHHDIYRKNLWEFVKRLSDRDLNMNDVCR